MTVVLLVAVVVMHNLFGFQWAPNHGFHHDDVFSNVSVVVSPRVHRPKQKPVSVFHDKRSPFAIARTLHRTKPGAVISSSPDSDSCSTGRAPSVAGAFNPRGFTFAIQRAEVPLARQFARWAMPSMTTSCALDIRKDGTASSGAATFKTNPAPYGQCSATHRERIALGVAMDASELKPARRVVQFGSTSCAVSRHATKVPRIWKQSDPGHFEFVP